MPFAERMGKGRYPNLQYIHASSAAASASSVASASASLAWGFYSWSGATCRLQKKCQNHHPPQLLPTFATLVSQPIQHDQSWMGSTTIILRICVLYTTFSSRAAETHFICGSLLLGWCFSFCNGFRSGFLAMELTAPMSSSASWASMS